jgi:hypothetical protein
LTRSSSWPGLEPGHPRLHSTATWRDVDGRDRPGHDAKVSRTRRRRTGEREEPQPFGEQALEAALDLEGEEIDRVGLDPERVPPPLREEISASVRQRPSASRSSMSKTMSQRVAGGGGGRGRPFRIARRVGVVRFGCCAGWCMGFVSLRHGYAPCRGSGLRGCWRTLGGRLVLLADVLWLLTARQGIQHRAYPPITLAHNSAVRLRLTRRPQY